MSDHLAPQTREPGEWREAVGIVGWLVLLVSIIGAAGIAFEALRGGAGQALHADPALVQDSFDSFTLGRWLVFAGAASTVVLAIIGKRWVLLTLSSLFFFLALVLTQVRLGA